MNDSIFRPLGSRWLLSLLMLAGLAACGGGGGDSAGGGDPPPPVTTDTLLDPQYAWPGTPPASAPTIDNDSFRRAVSRGELVPVGPGRTAAQQAARNQQLSDDKAYLAAIADPGPAVQALLAEAGALAQADGDVPPRRPGEAALQGVADQLRAAAYADRMRRDPQNLRNDYRQSYELLPADLKALAATPESLASASVVDLQTALHALNALLANPPSLDGTFRERSSELQVAPRGHALAVLPGVGADSDGECTPRYYATSFWFPLKRFVSPMKQQGNRGLCWAFTALGAVESRERVQNNNPVDLSEQFLASKLLLEWAPSDLAEAYFPEKALNLARDHQQRLPIEADWTYNPSGMRASDLSGSCNPYGLGTNAGTCSDTPHQAEQGACTLVNGKPHCSYVAPQLSGATGVPASEAVVAWRSGEAFDLNRLRYLLSQGVELMAAFPVYRGFDEVATAGSPVDAGPWGVVTQYDPTIPTDNGDYVAKSRGGHAVQVVGFLSNETLGGSDGPMQVGGGGYFIIKNSWGCGAGDAGYYYVPADYVERRFSYLAYLNFDARRSAAWTTAQAGPTAAPSITLKAPSVQADLRAATDLSGFFTVTQAVNRDVQLTVSETGLGRIYEGPWITDPGVLISSSLMHRFTTAGHRTLLIEARLGDQVSAAMLDVDVVNSPPGLTLQGSGFAYVGEPYAMAALVSDLNDADPSLLCASTRWAVDTPDGLSTPTGCTQRVTFGSTGERQVRATTRDAEGMETTRTLTVVVQPPPANPFPRITSAQVASREMVGALVKICGDTPVASGATIDFRQTGCISAVGDPAPPRYSGQLQVENPSGEVLHYEWRMIASHDGVDSDLLSGTIVPDAPQLHLVSPGNQQLVENALCHLSVIVRAPDPQRNKGLTVWTGGCMYLTGRLN